MRAFLNILSNGFRHTKDWLKLEILDGENEVSFSITDNGKGFEASKLEHLFVSTTGETVDGNGLGLLIVYEIIKKQDGNIVVENLETCGARIRISLPKRN